MSSKAWSITGRALIGLLVVAFGAALLIPQFSRVSLSAASGREEQIQSKIETALRQPVTLRFVDTPLNDVMDQIAREHSLDIILTKKLEDAGVSLDHPVTATANNISLESFLDRMLGDLNLTLMVQSESLLVTTIEDAQSPQNMNVSIYPVADLVDYFRLPSNEGGSVAMDFDSLINIVTTTIEPDSWQDVGGPGSISGHENSRTLVISTRRDIHQKIAGMLNTIRRAKRLQSLSMPSLPISSTASPPGSPSLSGPLPVRSRTPVHSPTVNGGGLF